MFQKSNSIRAYRLLMLFVSLHTSAAERIKGQVVDGGLADPGNGLAGVTVVIFEVATQKQLAEGITSGSGHYSIEIDSLIKKKLAASFSKLGYFARPQIQELAIPLDAQPSVKLAREGATVAYYKGIVDNIWKAKAESPDATKAFYSAVASLPAKEKAVVFDQIKLKDASALVEFVVADQAYLAAQKISTKLKFGGVPGAEQAVFVYPNFGSAGTMWLYGEVPSAADKKATEALIASHEGVAHIKTDLMIKKLDVVHPRYVPK